MIFAKQSTAIIVTVGPVLDADGVAVTGGVVGDFKASKNGGAPAALNGSATLTHRATGHYSLSLTTSDVDTVGTLEIIIDDTTNACPTKEIQVVEGAVYDALFADSAAGYQVPIWSSAGATVNLSATTIKTATDVETDTADIQSRLPAALVNSRMDCTIDGTGMETGAVDNILNRDASGSTTNSTLGAIINDWENGGRLDLIIDDILTDTGTTLQGELDGIQTTLGTPAGASISADILTLDNLVDDLESRIGTPSNLGGGATIAANLSDIESQTDDIGVAGAGLTDLGGFSTTAKGQIQTEAEDALVTHRLDELLNADSDIDGAAPPIVGSVFHELMSKTAGSFTFDQLTDSMEALRDNVGTTGAALSNVSANVVQWRGSSVAVPTTAGVPEVDVTYWVGNELTGVGIDGSGNVLPLVDVVAVSHDETAADTLELFAEALDQSTGQLDSGTFANGTITAAAIEADAFTAAKFAADVTTELQSGLATAAELAKVPKSDGTATWNATALASINTQVDTALADYDGPTNAELSTALAAADDAVLAAIAALNNLSAAQVNAEVVDALATDTYAEPGQGAPAATATLATKLGYLYKAWRNKKTQSSSELKLFADDASTVDQKSSVADDGSTLTSGEVASGP
jgi:hypothetical protein